MSRSRAVTSLRGDPWTLEESVTFVSRITVMNAIVIGVILMLTQTIPMNMMNKR